MSVLEVILLVLAAITLVPVCVVAAECAAAFLAPPSDAKTLASADLREASAERARVAVIVPAHDEELSIAATIAHLQQHLKQGDRLLVVADNCSDHTAMLSRQAGAEVVERCDDVRRGKGYALAAGVDSLRADPANVVIIVDADCRIDPGGVDALANQVESANLPAQAAYVMTTPEKPSPRDAVSSFAFLFKSVVRPRGLAALGLPCLLTGTGMAFPWRAIERANLATGDIVEDMRIGLELAIAGSPPIFCPGARVWSALPGERAAASTQRTRWEHGHLATLLRFVPRLIWHGVRRLRPKLLALALELGVPPLSLLVAWMSLLLALTTVAASLGASRVPLLLMGIAWMLLALAVLLGWWKFARQMISLKLLLSAPLYMLWKLPMYARFLLRPQKRWVRTQREGERA